MAKGLYVRGAGIWHQMGVCTQPGRLTFVPKDLTSLPHRHTDLQEPRSQGQSNHTLLQVAPSFLSVCRLLWMWVPEEAKQAVAESLQVWSTHQHKGISQASPQP